MQEILPYVDINFEFIYLSMLSLSNCSRIILSCIHVHAHMMMHLSNFIKIYSLHSLLIIKLHCSRCHTTASWKFLTQGHLWPTYILSLLLSLKDIFHTNLCQSVILLLVSGCPLQWVTSSSSCMGLER